MARKQDQTRKRRPRRATLRAQLHDTRQQVYCASHRCYECGYMVGYGRCTFSWKLES